MLMQIGSVESKLLLKFVRLLYVHTYTFIFMIIIILFIEYYNCLSICKYERFPGTQRGIGEHFVGCQQGDTFHFLRNCAGRTTNDFDGNTGTWQGIWGYIYQPFCIRFGNADPELFQENDNNINYHIRQNSMECLHFRHNILHIYVWQKSDLWYTCLYLNCIYF